MFQHPSPKAAKEQDAQNTKIPNTMRTVWKTPQRCKCNQSLKEENYLLATTNLLYCFSTLQ